MWFKVDDAWHSHPKVAQCSFAARGLWVTAGSWCSQHLTDGAVPKVMLRQWGAKSVFATELVAAGLWTTTQNGWQFHDWMRMNPSKKDVVEQRDKVADRQRKWRVTNASVTRDETSDKSVTNASVDRLSRTRGSRPDPTRPEEEERESTLDPVSEIRDVETLERPRLRSMPEPLPGQEKPEPPSPTFCDDARKYFGESFDADERERTGHPTTFGWLSDGGARNDPQQWALFEERCREAAARVPGIDPADVGARVIDAFFARPWRNERSRLVRFMVTDFGTLARSSDRLRAAIEKARGAA